MWSNNYSLFKLMQVSMQLNNKQVNKVVWGSNI